MTAGIECDAGSYCPGTNDVYPGSATTIQIRPTPCPAGTYGSAAGSDDSGDCTACDAGSYCDTPGQLVVGGTCEAGFVCVEGNDRPGPYASVYDQGTSTSGKCTVGHYCEGGALTETACPAKFYSVNQQSSSCLSCPPGSYCTGGAHKQSCDSGYYCDSESNVPAPTDGVMGDICPVNHFCESG